MKQLETVMAKDLEWKSRKVTLSPSFKLFVIKWGSPFRLQFSKQMLLKLCFMSGMTQSILTEKPQGLLTSKGIQPHRTQASKQTSVI